MQLAALMESQRKVAGYAKGPGGGSNALACVPCLRRCLGWGGCPGRNCGLIKVVLGQLRQAETPSRSAAGYKLLDQGRAAIAVLSGLGRLTVHVDRDLGLREGRLELCCHRRPVGADAYGALQHLPGAHRDPPRHDRSFLPADCPLAVNDCFCGRPAVVADRQRGSARAAQPATESSQAEAAALSGAFLLASLTALPRRRPTTAAPG